MICIYFPRIEFNIDGAPVPQQQRTWWHGTYWNPSQGAMYTTAAKAQIHAPRSRWTGPIALELTFTRRPRVDNPQQLPSPWATRRPDLDNYCKLMLDALQRAGFYNDDAQIVRLVASKVHGEVESTNVIISKL
jgi:Holliday junction resolvase RusA-like endonuclease